MGNAGEKKRRATYQDVLDAPEHLVAEIVAGELHLSPRPGGPATSVGSKLFARIGSAFDDDGRDGGGPGGWLILFEPELHFGDDIVVPDIAGWRRETMSMVADEAYFSIAPDWICEVLSRSTEKFDRAEKLAVYAAAGVEHAWLVHPKHRTLEIFRRDERAWTLVGIHKDDDRLRAEPFEAIELDLARLWSDLPFSSRANEGAAEYADGW